MIKNLDHINIVARSLEEHLRFFELLGFERVAGSQLKGLWIDKIVGLEDVDAEYICLALKGCTTKIELIRYDNPSAPSEMIENCANMHGLRHIAFEVEDIEEIVQKLKSEGVEFFSEIQVYSRTNKKLVYFYGPEGIILELAEYGSC